MQLRCQLSQGGLLITLSYDPGRGHGRLREALQHEHHALFNAAVFGLSDVTGRRASCVGPWT